jgi:signal transduction histidine kinase
VLGKLRPTTAARLAWSFWASAFGLSVASTLVRQTPNSWFNATFFALATTGAVIAWRRPANPIGWLYLAMSFLGALTTFAQQYAIRGLLEHPGSLPGAVYLAWLEQWSFWFVFPAGIALVLLLFPTGRPASPRWRPVVWISLACALLMVVGSMLSPGRLSDALRPPSGPGADFGVQNPFGIGALGGALNLADAIGRLGGFLFIVIAAVGLVFRLLRARGDEREQLKWVAFVGSAIAVGVLGTIFLGSTGPFGLPGSPALQDFAFAVLLAGFVVGLPVATAIAVLKYRLYDIDLVINKSLVYGALAIFITTVYVGIVVGIGRLVGTSGKPNIGLSILATALVAVAFQPVRERIQRVANRLVYGNRATPYEVLSQFSQRVADVYSTEDVLPQMATVLGEGTGASRADVWIRLGDGIAPAASWPAGDGPSPSRVAITGQLLPTIPGLSRIVAVRHRDELLGALSINKRPGEALTPIEEKLIADLAAQAGIVLQSVRLSAQLQARLTEISQQAIELRASRQRIVATQDAERRRLERNIHDGAQQNLVALTVKLRLATALAKRDPERARVSVRALEAESDEALETLRALASGIYPPLLREQGLSTALRAETAKMPVPATVRADHVHRYPPEVEAAVYFVCLEALQNVAKHARTSRVEIDLRSLAEELSFEVTDDGAGFDLATDARGSGLRNMMDRIEGIGGRLEIRSAAGIGTTISGTVPARAMLAAS